jgi:hypothetical protein
MKRKAYFAIVSILMFFLLVAFRCQNDIVRAYDYLDNGGSIPSSRVGAESPIITLSYLQNNSFCNDDNITLTLNVTVGGSALNSSRWLDLIYYSVDWQQKNNYVYRYMNDEWGRWNYSTSLNLTGVNDTKIPEGTHTLTVTVNEEGQYLDPPVPSGYAGLNKIVYYSFEITGSTSVIFTIDRTSPNIHLSLENKTYFMRNIPLNFTIDEAVSSVKYSIDNQGNTTIAGNTILNGLSVGEHNLTVYAWDTAGNVGTSETIAFTIADSFPMIPMVIVCIIAVAIVGIGSLFYYKKRQHRN